MRVVIALAAVVASPFAAYGLYSALEALRWKLRP